MRERLAPRVLAVAPLLAWLPIALTLGTALARLRYPFELHWMEGLTLDHVRRVWAGEPIYVAPTLDFVPYLYTPLYYYVAAALGAFVGEGFVALRLTSLGAFVAMMLALALLVRRETGSARAGLLSAGLLAATYGLNSAWFDLGRVDSLFLAFALWGLALLRLSERPLAWALAGLLWALAYLTKQLALMMAAPLALALLWEARGRALWFIVPWLGAIAAATLWLDGQSGGWFRFYTAEMVGTPYHAVGMVRLAGVISFWVVDILRPLWPALLLGAIYLAWAWRRERRSARFYGAVALGMIGLSWLQRSKADTDLNGIMPAHAALALLAGLGWPRLVAAINALDPGVRRPTSLGVGAALALFLVGLLYNPVPFLPTAEDRAAGEAVVARLRAVEGDPFIPYHSYLAPLAGKPAHAHAIPIGDLLRSGQPPREALIAEMEDALAGQRFGALVLDDRQYLSLVGRDEAYELRETLFEQGDRRFIPPTGTPYRPLFLWLPRE